MSDLLDELGKQSLFPKGLREKALELDKADILRMEPEARKKYTPREASELIDYAREIIILCKSLLSQT